MRIPFWSSSKPSRATTAGRDEACVNENCRIFVASASGGVYREAQYFVQLPLNANEQAEQSHEAEFRQELI